MLINVEFGIIINLKFYKRNITEKV